MQGAINTEAVAQESLDQIGVVANSEETIIGEGSENTNHSQAPPEMNPVGPVNDNGASVSNPGGNGSGTNGGNGSDIPFISAGDNLSPMQTQEDIDATIAAQKAKDEAAKSHQAQAPPSTENLKVYGYDTANGQIAPESPNKIRWGFFKRIGDFFAGRTKVTFVASSDGHGHIFTREDKTKKKRRYSNGAAALAELVARERRANPNTIVVNEGDETAGALVVNENPGVVAKIFKMLGTKFAILGNHDTDNLSKLSNFLKEAGVGNEGTDLTLLGGLVRGFEDKFKLYHIETVYPYHIGPWKFGTPRKIAVIGIGMSGPGITVGDDIGMQTVKEILTTAFENMKANGENPDAIVVLTHQSHTDPRENTVGKLIEFLQSDEGYDYARQINVVIGGHKHQLISDKPFGEEGPLFVEPSNYYEGAAVVNLLINRKGSVSATYNMFGFRNMKIRTKEGKEMYNYTNDIWERDLKKLDEPIIEIQGNLSNVVPQGAEYVDATAPNNMADALHHAAMGQARNMPGVPAYSIVGMSSRMNYYRGTGTATNYNGPMTFNKLGETAPYNEYAKVVRVTGEQIVEIIKNNIKIIDGVPTAIFTFSNNLRANIKFKRDANGEIIVNGNNVEVEDIQVEIVNNSAASTSSSQFSFIPMQPSESRPVETKTAPWVPSDNHWVNINLEDNYYIVALYHMLDGFFEASNLKSMNLTKEVVYSFETDQERNTTYKVMKNYYNDVDAPVNPETGRKIYNVERRFTSDGTREIENQSHRLKIVK